MSLQEGGFWKPADPNNSVPFRGSRSGGSSEEQQQEQQQLQFPPLQSAAALLSNAPLQQQRLLLPIYKHKRQILYCLEQFHITVIVGETGSGKSTQIPQYLREGGWCDKEFQIAITQPRRMAAITLAQRVAEEIGDGKLVGYSVPFESRTSPWTQLKYLTDSMLLQETTQGDPLMSNYSVIMIDEAHDRTLETDALLGLLLKIRKQRPELRIVICSATIQAQPFLDFFCKTDKETKTTTTTTGTVVSVDGRQFPVDTLFLKDPAPNYVTSAVETAWKIHSNKRNYCGGDILCFLPTPSDIDEAIRLAQDYFDQQQRKTANVDFLPLYDSLPYQMQTRIFQNNTNNNGSSRKPNSRRRRVIFATHMAETSVTIPNIEFVIDSGLVQLPYFDPIAGVERRLVTPISQASVQQRAGRAGRVQMGKFVALYTQRFYETSMIQDTPPEILRTNLTSLLLILKAVGVDNVLAFDLLDFPTVDALQHGLESLFALGAMDSATSITPEGIDMSQFPVDPRIARMLLESLSRNCAWEVLAVASALLVRDLWRKPRQEQQLVDYRETLVQQVGDPSGDFVTYANILAQFETASRDACQESFVNYLALKRALEVRSELARLLRRFGRVSSFGDEEGRSRAIRQCVTSGFFMNIAKLDNDGQYYTLRKHILVTPSRSSLFSEQLLPSEYIIYGETRDDASKHRRVGLEARHVSAVEARWLQEMAPHYWQ